MRTGTGTAAIGCSLAVATLLAGAVAKAALTADCPLHAMTGLLCPGCGATRGVVALVHGDLGAAAHDNLLLLLALGAALITAVVPTLGRRLLVALVSSYWPLRVAAVLSLLFFGLRNLPGMGALRPA